MARTDAGRRYRIGRADLRDALTWRAVLGSVTVLLLTVGFYTGIGLLRSQGGAEPGAYLQSMAFQLRMMVPIVGVVFGYSAIARRRERHTIRLFLSASYSREDVYVGTLASRVVAASLPAGITASTICGIVLALASPRPMALVVFCLSTLALTGAFTSVAVAAPVVGGTARRALGASLLVFVTSIVLWSPVVSLATLPTEGSGASETISGLVWSLAPTQAYSFLVQAGVPGVDGPGAIVVAASGLSLFGWSFLPAVIGHWWFSRMDI
ncbi:ABC transporter permease subunit [Halomicrobium salinisoli]|uniref:ABC transporter permease subunit n=1 Tax=Halomicrobium salinisoli TaxID=2878391 RepID=UPI001CF0BA7A|nr:ABC transporter permease subunit [Halomicrobium salinisoli]